MKRFFLFLLLLLFPGLIFSQPLRINVFASNNGKGLENSRRILKQELLEMGHIVIEKEFYEQVAPSDRYADINIFFEIINTHFLTYANANWFIPNPECYGQSQGLLNSIDLILCRTHEVERIFKNLGKETFYIGFTSQDCQDLFIDKDFYTYLHAAGGSPWKGTDAVVKTWKNDKTLPFIHILAHDYFPADKEPHINWMLKKIPLADLRLLQNRCGVHLCLSETEGFGHYLMEAMSTGAVVLTTDAPPMNEFIEDTRCLVPYTRLKAMHLGIRYFVDSFALGDVVRELMNLSEDELREIGQNNRENYIRKTQEFKDNLRQLFNSSYPSSNEAKL